MKSYKLTCVEPVDKVNNELANSAFSIIDYFEVLKQKALHFSQNEKSLTVDLDENTHIIWCQYSGDYDSIYYTLTVRLRTISPRNNYLHDFLQGDKAFYYIKDIAHPVLEKELFDKIEIRNQRNKAKEQFKL